MHRSPPPPSDDGGSPGRDPRRWLLRTACILAAATLNTNITLTLWLPDLGIWFMLGR